MPPSVDPTPANVVPAAPNCAPDNAACWPAATSLFCASCINGAKDPTPEPASEAALCCNTSCPATVGANLEVSRQHL